MTAVLTQWVDRFLPDSIRDSSGLRKEELVYSRVLVFINLLTFLLCLLHVATFVLLDIFSNHDFGVTIIFGLISASLSFSLYFLFYRTGQLRAAVMLFSTTFVVVLLVCIAITGGPHSPLMPVLISSPIVASVIGGRHEALYNSLV